MVYTMQHDYAASEYVQMLSSDLCPKLMTKLENSTKLLLMSG